ncbi:MAG: replicative DNA helicase [Bacteroidaceae bacterium]|nr:replicative DNA helicase [Bacteroidaceae bacterium]MBQ6693743.1 replicative DNA helicase [Bacteroidaceae bacterium]
MDENNTQRRKTRRQAEGSAPLMNQFGNLQPQALELEEAVLGALMVDSDAIGRLGSILKPDSFYDKRNRLLFGAIQEMDLNDRPIDILTVTEFLKSKGILDEVGGPVYIAQLSSRVVSSVNIEYHATIIAQKKLARDLIKFTSKTQEQAFDETQDVDELMQQAESELFEISRHNMKQDFTQINPVIKQAYEQIQTASKNTSGISGLSTGYHRLDKVLSGWQPTDLIILAARPAMGKTAFALSLIRNMAVDQGIPVGMFSLEMGNVQLVQRLISNVCQIPGDKIRSGQLERYEWGQLDSKITALEGAPLYIDDTPQLSVFELRSKARRMVHDYGVKMIFIDYLQLMTANVGKGSRQEEISTISRSLKGLAKELNIPIMALSQLNRNLEGREGVEGKRPQLSDLRESGAIEQDADIVMFVNRPEYFHIYKDGDFDWRGKAEIIIAKHRNGGLDNVPLVFRKEYARFMNLDDESISAPPPSDIPVMRASKMNVNVASYDPAAITGTPPPIPDYLQDGAPVDMPVNLRPSGNDEPMPF